MPRPFVRARKPEEKEERRAQILRAARALLDGGVELRDLSLNELARRAGLAKANVYRYFESREAVLLALLQEESARLLLEVPLKLHRRRGETVSIDALVTLIARTLAEEPIFCGLVASLPSVLERNLSEEAIRSYKRQSLSSLGEASALLERGCPALSAAKYAEFLYDVMSVVAGLYPSTHPAPAAARALAAPDLSFFRREFGAELERFLRALATDHATRSPPTRGASSKGRTRSP